MDVMMDHTDGRKVRKSKVTRACDYCKNRKAKCSGTKPCDICARKGLVCNYDALYLRGKPPTPPASVTPAVSSIDHVGLHPGESRSSHALSPSTTQNAEHSLSRGSADPQSGDAQGQYIDPASGLSFLDRARRRLALAERPHDLTSMQQGWQQQHVFRAGDKPMLGNDNTWSFPSYQDALGMIEFYFDICIATYRVLHKPTVEQWLSIVENNRKSGRTIFSGLDNAKAATLMGVLAIAHFVGLTVAGTGSDRDSTLQSDGLIRQALRLTDYEGGFPSLESIQARLLQVFYHLMTCRFNHAWYVFGHCLQMIAAMGLQRKSSLRRDSGRLDYLTDQHRKRIFWSAYVLDKYLGVVVGRPPHFHDEDIDQEEPDRVNDEHMFADGPRGGGEDSLVDAFVFNIRIARIVGTTSRCLYGISPSNEQDRLAAINRLGTQIDEWHASLPPFLSTVRASSLIRSLRRQSNALKLAHGHALMHLYRPLLLGDFVRPRRPSMAALVEDGATRCIKAAQKILEAIAAGTREGGGAGAAFWWTHYVTFCALAVVYVWILQRRRNAIERQADVDEAQLLELAETCQDRLKEATTLNSPCRKYTLILDELRSEARKPGTHSHLGTRAVSTPSVPYAPPPAPSASGPSGYQGMPMDHQTPINAPTQASTDGMSSIDTPDWLTDWTNNDWLDLDASAFGILSDMNADLITPQEPM